MKCSMRTLNIISLTLGLIAVGALAIAVCTDYWVYTREIIRLKPEAKYGEDEDSEEVDDSDARANATMHSGLWRVCVYQNVDLIEGDPAEDELESISPVCTTIGYFQSWERIDGADVTNSILRAIRKSSPVIVVSLLIMLFALGLSTLGNSKRDYKTMIGAVLFIAAALLLGIGVIFYISAVNDEVSHQKKPEKPDDPPFQYRYGWAFFFAGSSFMCCMIAAVANISLYIKRYPNIEDMVLIVPGLDKKSNYDFSKSEEMESDIGMQNPTIIL